MTTFKILRGCKKSTLFRKTNNTKYLPKVKKLIENLSIKVIQKSISKLFELSIITKTVTAMISVVKIHIAMLIK